MVVSTARENKSSGRHKENTMATATTTINLNFKTDSLNDYMDNDADHRALSDALFHLLENFDVHGAEVTVNL